jgi:hypothetical protein
MPAAAAHGAPPPTPKPHPAHLHRARRTTGHTPDTADTTRVAGLGGGRARGPGAGPARASGPGRPPQGVPLQGWDAAPGRPGARGRARSAPPPRAVISKAQRTAGHDPRAMFLCFILNLPTAETVRRSESKRAVFLYLCSVVSLSPEDSGRPRANWTRFPSSPPQGSCAPHAGHHTSGLRDASHLLTLKSECSPLLTSAPESRVRHASSDGRVAQRSLH